MMHLNFMSKAVKGSICILVIAVLANCGVGQSYTREALYPKMYSEKPVSILIMPPINQTNHVDAKEFFYSSMAQPLAERGYYVFSPYLSLDLMQQESANDAEQFIEGSMKPFRNVFNADAVLFTVIKKWSKAALANEINVEIEYILKSATTNETLFQRNADVKVDCSVIQNGGIIGILANTLMTAATDKIVAARKANHFILSDMPAGKYSPDYGIDGKMPASSSNINNYTVK